MVIPDGFTSIQTPEGTKITRGDNVFLLIAPSDQYLKDQAFDQLNGPSETTETRLFSGGSWERTNDYGTLKRNWTERNAGGGVVQSFQTDIPQVEADARRVNEDLVSAEGAVLAASGANPLRVPLLQLIRHIKGRNPDAELAEITLSQLRARVGDVVNVEVRMSRTFNGLAGFIFSAAMTARNCKFVDVVFPAAFPLADHDPDPVDGPVLNRVAGVDLGSTIQGAQSDVLLATLRVEATGVGDCGITLNVSQLDDDDGFPIASIAKDGLVSVS